MDTDAAIALQNQTNEGQKKINGQLCYVDRLIIETIKLLKIAIASSPQFSNRINFDEIDRKLRHAYDSSAAVASVKPPGCEPPYYGDPNWTPNSGG
ncbi:MAG TPA: hypothetical protein VFS77_05130 [Pyrinomonadaceae bacterium]|nr:hypothetical protein [Pyrinomonadaceae bacterium]